MLVDVGAFIKNRKMLENVKVFCFYIFFIYLCNEMMRER